MKRKTRRFKQTLQRHFNDKKTIRILIIFVGILFPFLLLSLNYFFPDFYGGYTGNLLSYYGVFGGLIISVWTYQDGKEREEKKRRNNLKPQFAIKVSEFENTAGLYTLSVFNFCNKPLRSVSLNGDAHIVCIEKEGSFNIDCRCDQEETYNFNNKNSTVYIEPDDEGLPSFVEICCDDEEGNTWAFDYKKVHYNKEYSYLQYDSYIIN